MCVLVCLSVAFKLLNRVTDCYKSGVNIYDELGGHHDDLGFNDRLLAFQMMETGTSSDVHTGGTW